MAGEIKEIVMKCMLRIGYMEILLPDDKNIGKIIETLSKGVECRYSSYEKRLEIQDEIEVSVKILPASTKIEVSEEMQEKAEAIFNPAQKRKSAQVAGRQPLILIEKKGR
jgi:hypothetical protein